MLKSVFHFELCYADIMALLMLLFTCILLRKYNVVKSELNLAGKKT